MKTDLPEFSYVVRVYRCDAKGCAGVVEMPVQARQEKFRNFAELNAILARESTTTSRRSRGRRE